MWPDHQLLEDAEALLGAGPCAAELLDVQVARIHRIEVGEGPGDAIDHLGSLPLAVAPLGIEIAESAHLEGEQRLERDGDGEAAMWCERDLGGARTACAGPPAHAVIDRRHRLGSTLIEA